MPFKVVQTIENGKTVLSAIPSQWEENNLLYWPNNRSKLRILLQEEFSIPDKDKWEKLPCTIKRNNLKSIVDAEHEIDVMELISDTEEEEVPQKLYHRKKASATKSNIPDFNAKIFTGKGSRVGTSTEILSNGSSTASAKPGSSSSAGLEPPANVIILDNILLNQKPGESLMQTNNSNFVVLTEENIDKWNDPTDTNKALLNQILGNQNIIIAQQAKLQTSLDSLVSLIAETATKQTPEDTQIQEKKEDGQSFKPIESPTELDHFEQKLNDLSFLNSVVSNMSLICGKTGKSNGIDSCYMLIDYFLTREFVSRCSWTGQSKNAEQKKTPLKFYKNFRKCFFNIILLADRDFSEVECETFFKRVLKNSVARKTQKYESKHKRRPTNLSYSKKSKDDGIKEKEREDNYQTHSNKDELSDQETINDKSQSENNDGDLSDT